MADHAFTLKIVTPDEVVFEGRTISIVAPGTVGYLGVLKDHAPLVTTLGKGQLTYKSEDGKINSFQVEGGFLEVFKNRVLVLADHVSKTAAVA